VAAPRHPTPRSRWRADDLIELLRATWAALGVLGLSLSATWGVWPYATASAAGHERVVAPPDGEMVGNDAAHRPARPDPGVASSSARDR